MEAKGIDAHQRLCFSFRPTDSIREVICDLPAEDEFAKIIRGEMWHVYGRHQACMMLLVPASRVSCIVKGLQDTKDWTLIWDQVWQCDEMGP